MSRNISVAAILMFLTGVQAQHGVILSSQSLCSVTGSTVKITCRFTTPDHSSVTQREWYRVQSSEREPQDLSKDPRYSGRVYVIIWGSDCKLTVKKVRVRDSGVYNFRFKTQSSDWISDSTGVNLTVTDLKVTVSDSGNGQMNLICITTCPLSNNPTYIWYKNGHRVSDCKSASCSVAAVSGAVSYSCAVEGHDSLLSPPVYSPENTRAVILSSGDTVEGKSVTLSCSSDANPPLLTYSWFKQSTAADTLLTTDQNYSISNINSQHSGLYYCTAHNQLGHHNSTPTHLDVLHSPKNTRAVILSSGDTVEGKSVTLSCSSDANPPVLTYSWFKQSTAADTLLTTDQNYSISNINSQHSGLYYCTAHNQLGHHNSTPTHLDVLREVWKLHAVWGTAALVPALILSILTAVLCIKTRRRAERNTDVQCAPKQDDNTYIGLNPMHMSSDYDTLQVCPTRLSEETYSRIGE